MSGQHEEATERYYAVERLSELQKEITRHMTAMQSWTAALTQERSPPKKLSASGARFRQPDLTHTTSPKGRPVADMATGLPDNI